MRLEVTSKEDQYKCWLTDDDLEELRRAAGSHRDDLVIQLGGDGSVLLREPELFRERTRLTGLVVAHVDAPPSDPSSGW